VDKATILVVDDDDAIVEVIRAALEDEGYRVLSAINGAALGLARDRQPNLILLDIMMPEMDGVEVSRRLRADPTTASIPIVAMSAHNRLRATGDAMAADDRLPKPFELGDLYAAVERWATTT
jgi:CheY-like chemotaxis protein